MLVLCLPCTNAFRVRLPHRMELPWSPNTATATKTVTFLFLTSPFLCFSFRFNPFLFVASLVIPFLFEVIFELLPLTSII